MYGWCKTSSIYNGDYLRGLSRVGDGRQVDGIRDDCNDWQLREVGSEVKVFLEQRLSVNKGASGSKFNCS